MKKLKLKRSDVNHFLKFFGFSSAPIRSITAILFIGVTIGVAYEELIGIGTWHRFHPSTEKFNVCFTPPSGCGSLIAQEVSKAEKTIYVQAYGLTSLSIIHQLKSAHSRGVKVSILLDGGNLSNNDSVYQDFKNFGIDVFIDKMPGIAHNKIMIIDGKKVITGSFNFTNAADTRNAENVLLIEDENIAAQYLDNWQSRLAQSK